MAPVWFAPLFDRSIIKSDWVATYDKTTQAPILAGVKQTFSKTWQRMVRLVAGGDTVMTTNNHPFYLPSLGRYLRADSLRRGMKLLALAGTLLTVQHVEALDTLLTVYNFEVEDQHNYYVGNTGVLVHNDCVFIKAGLKNTAEEGITGNEFDTFQDLFGLGDPGSPTNVAVKRMAFLEDYHGLSPERQEAFLAFYRGDAPYAYPDGVDVLVAKADRVRAWEVAFDVPNLRVKTDWLSRTDNWIRDGLDQVQIKKLLSEAELSPQLRQAFELDEINFNSWDRIDRGSPSFKTANFSGYLATLKKMTHYDNTASSTDVVKYYRVQGGGSGSATSMELLTVQPNGNLIFNDKTRELYFSTDDLDHAIYYTTGQGTNINGVAINRPPPRPGGVIIEFEVPKWLDNQMKSEAIPQHRAGLNPLNNNSPQIVDPTQPGHPFGIKENWQTLIESNYIEGSARIVE